MNNRKILSLSYFLGRTFFLGFGISLLMSISSHDTWIVSITGTILGCLIIKIFSILKTRLGNSLLTKDNSFLKWLIIIIFFIYNTFIFSQIIFIFQTFAASFFLIKSPIVYITLPIPFIVYRACQGGIKTISKVGEILMPISILLIFLGIIGLMNNYELDSFRPVAMLTSDSLIKGTLYYAFYSAAPFILLLNTPIKEAKLIKDYLISSITIILIIIGTISCLGNNLITVYRYPEYMVLKKIKLFNFIEKVENIVSISWLFDLFMTLTISGNNIKECLPKKKIYFIIYLIIMYILSIISGIYYQTELMLYHALPIILGSFVIIFFLLLAIYTRKKTQ